jgi:predicted Ser/Thr protein kinase
LRAACADDEELRREVENLLAESGADDEFFNRPLFQVSLSLLARQLKESIVGKEFRRCTILRELGRGGMGEVYLAEDAQLGRRVALRILPVYLTDNREPILRFQQEARAASAISHPNIAHIYEIGDSDGIHFIMMEYVEGTTLRQILRSERLSGERALEIARQVADALRAAHQAGVVHRDIKPENIIVRRDGYVKVLDFGLAKLVENASVEASPNETARQARSSLDTSSGTILGTTALNSISHCCAFESGIACAETHARLFFDHHALRVAHVTRSVGQRVSARFEERNGVGRESVGFINERVGQPLMMDARRVNRLLNVHVVINDI